MSPELTLLVQTLVILTVPVALWRFSGLRHAVPLVCVQILVGIALGPSGFGRLAPELFHLVFSPTALTPISSIATMAVLLFGYVTGLHLEPSGIMRRGRAFAFVAASSLGVPTIAGFLGGLWLAALDPAGGGGGIGAVGVGPPKRLSRCG